MADLAYRPYGRVKKMNNGAGDLVEAAHDLCGRLTVANPATPREQRFTYDANGNLLQTLWPEQSWEDRHYGYDAQNRLTSASGPWGEMGFTYDAAGNRESRDANGMVETYSYLPGTNRLSGVYGEGGTDYYQYDDAGNRTTGDGKQFEYDQENRLERCYAEGALVGEYTYNGLGQRVAKTVEGVTTLFVYDQDGRLILETEAGAEGAGREYLHRGENRLAMYDIAGYAWYFFQNDHIGTPVAVTDADNRIVWEAVYLPCGEAAVNPASLIEFNLRFAGQYYDKETGLLYNYHRYYDPKTGRYLTPDPIGLAGGIDLYTYTHNNPINMIDPYGLIAIADDLIIAGGALIIGSAYYAMLPPDQQQAVANDVSRFWDWLWNENTEDEGGSCEVDNDKGDDDDHFKQRKDEAKAGDSHREIGDTNRTIQQGNTYIDTDTGNTVHVRGNRVVVTDGSGNTITQFKNPRANTLNRIRTGRWVPTK